MANQIKAIKPYKWEGLWVFDDERVGLDKEPFVAGADAVIDVAVERQGIREPEKGFVLLFSGDRFPGATMELTWVRHEMNGDVYVWEGREAWLCPALLKYFPKAPAKIFAQFRDRGS
jgi:hypothetical protein